MQNEKCKMTVREAKRRRGASAAPPRSGPRSHQGSRDVVDHNLALPEMGAGDYRQTRVLHEVLLKAVREVTGKEVAFIQWNGTGPSRP